MSPQDILHALHKATYGYQQLSVSVVSLIRGTTVTRFYQEHVGYMREDDEIVAHLGCFPPVTEDVDCALRELTMYCGCDYYVGYDAKLKEYFVCVPSKQIFGASANPALAISKVLVKCAMAKEKATSKPVALDEASTTSALKHNVQ